MARVQVCGNSSTRDDLGGSDRPLNPIRRTRPGAAAVRLTGLGLPAVFGPIAVTYNLDGVNTLNLDGPTTAKIFNAGITTWNDPAIKAASMPTPTCPQRRFNVVFATTSRALRTTSRNICRQRPTAPGVRHRRDIRRRHRPGATGNGDIVRSVCGRDQQTMGLMARYNEMFSRRSSHMSRHQPHQLIDPMVP